ncbi:hypothetical protein ACWDZ8_17605 [Streptomyces sp. NPDC003233]
MHAAMWVRAGVHAGPAEASRLVDALWAHADPLEGLEHVHGRAEERHVDLIFFFRQSDYGQGVTQRAISMLSRCHEASELIAAIYERPRI